MTGPASDSAGLYVHLPYCVSRCEYCAFVVTTDESSRGQYLDALAREIEIVGPEADGVAFDTLYFGGGTPSRVPAADLSTLLVRLKDGLAIHAGAEVTLEANPDDVTLELATVWRGAGITRVSLGVQSLDDRELAAVGRRHDAATARRALACLTEAGFSVSADLILGLPGQTAESFTRSLEQILESGVGHVSVYLLETEKSKAIEQDRRDHTERYLSDDAQAEAWLALSKRMTKGGWEHYEISNWALPGSAGRHNLKYWRRVPTLGLGVAAHEFWRGARRANVSAIPAYLSSLGAGRRPTALDQPVSEDETLRERIVLGLRLSEGVAQDEIAEFLRRNGDEKLGKDLAAWREEGLCRILDGRLRLTERGFLVSNEILCRFI